MVEVPTMNRELKNGAQKLCSAEVYCSSVGVKRIWGGST